MADNLDERAIEDDLFGNAEEISERVEDNNSNDTENNDHDTANSTNAPSTILKDKRPLRLGDDQTKKPKLSMPEAYLEAIKMKDETKKDMLNFNRTKWEEEIEEKKNRWKAEDEQREQDRKIALIRAETERSVAKNALIMTLSTLGLSPEKVLEKLNDL